ncbi:MAG: 4Fe-4S dicluster domain-containing protein [Pseudomonadota bacterium]
MEPFQRLIYKHDAVSFLETLLPFHGPLDEAGKSRFGLIGAKEDLARLNLCPVSPGPPLKGFLFPQTETILSYGQVSPGGGGSKAPSGRRSVFFGVRPCDGRAFDALDSHFIQYAADAAYTQRRESSVLVGLGCNQPGPNCFCSSVKGGPFSTAGLDALWSDIGEAYLIEAFTARGREMFEGGAMLKEAAASDLKKKEEAEKAALGLFERRVETDGIKEQLEEDNDDGLWNELARKCIGCGICAYLCPTCYCFLAYNDEVRGQGRRVRTWTSCQFPKFIFQPTGKNLRPTKASRIKRRVWDKFKEFPDRFGKLACMGCGRCTDNCPVDIDLVEIISTLQRHHDSAAGGGEQQSARTQAGEPTCPLR